MPARSRRAGFSLTETMIALGLLAALLLATAPQFQVPPAFPAGLAARQVAADLGLARRLAIAGRVNYVVTFAPSAGPYTSYAVAPAGGSPGVDFPKSFPAGVVVTGAPQIIFIPSGAATAPAVFTFSDGAASAQVQVVAATGFVQVSGP